MTKKSRSKTTRRIDMTKPPTISAGAAAYIKKNDAELADLASRAEACLSALDALQGNEAVISKEGKILEVALLPSDTLALTGMMAKELEALPFATIREKIRHVMRMSKETMELHRIVREKRFNQSVTRILYSSPKPASTMNDLFGGKSK